MSSQLMPKHAVAKAAETKTQNSLEVGQMTCKVHNCVRLVRLRASCGNHLHAPVPGDDKLPR